MESILGSILRVKDSKSFLDLEMGLNFGLRKVKERMRFLRENVIMESIRNV
jgi:hypothetical protein